MLINLYCVTDVRGRGANPNKEGGVDYLAILAPIYDRKVAEFSTKYHRRDTYDQICTVYSLTFEDTD